jgi:YjbE family integral membrane protein
MDFLMELNWLAVGQIILIDILLGGDNAIVIALACRNLPPQHRMKGILWGTAGAIGIRIVLIAFAITLLQLPFIKLVGGLLLLWIGLKLLTENDDHVDVAGSDKLFAAIKTIVIADLVMSVDNVIAIASAAEQAGEHQFALIVFGILVSIPIIVWGSTLVLKLMEKFPIIITLGAALLGYLAGGMITTDTIVVPWLSQHVSEEALKLMGFSIPGIIGAILVVVTGKWIQKSRAAKTAA